MPRFDGTGPYNQGPKTGKGLGNCTDQNINVQTQRPMYFGGGRMKCMRRGFGRGMRNYNNMYIGIRKYNMLKQMGLTDQDIEDMLKQGIYPTCGPCGMYIIQQYLNKKNKNNS